jgi:hypothetical protein
MESIMELDELKSAWQALDRQLQRQNAMKLDALRERRLGRTRGSLRPLWFGQVAQMLFGLLFVLLAALLWSSDPQGAAVIAAGVAVHAYGVATIVAAGVVLGQLGRIDYAAPVLDIQKQLARARTLYVRSGMVAGLPWWGLWVLVLMVLAGLGDIDLLARAPAMVWTGLGIGLAGLAGTWWFHCWVRQPGREAWALRSESAMTGGSLRRAQAHLDEIARFERE